VPSQRFLVSKMIMPVPRSYSGRIVELGAGNGVLTLRLAARCPQARVIACEINPALARQTTNKLVAAGLDERVKVVPDAAEHLLSSMIRSSVEKPDFVISGIPLGNLREDREIALIEKISQALGETGMYIQFQYSLLGRRLIQSKFRTLRTVPVFLNFPPAVIYYARK
jgi:phosphatidylethanolamine/phosphatidyl-N-methylethanolamine N-methyltransferase